FWFSWASQIRSKYERGSKSYLVIVEAKTRQRTVILAVEIIRTEAPKPSDRDIDRGLDEIIIVHSVRARTADRAEIIGVFLSADDAQINSLQKSLTKTGGDIRAGKILSTDNCGIISAPRPSQYDRSPVERRVDGAEFKYRRNVGVARTVLKLAKLDAA